MNIAPCRCSFLILSVTLPCAAIFFFFFFNDTATTEIYTLSLHDALPICLLALCRQVVDFGQIVREAQVQHAVGFVHHQELHLVELDLHRALQVQQTAGSGHHEVGVLQRSEEHTSELQSPCNLVCRLLLEK